MRYALPILLALVLALPAAAKWEQQDFVILLGWPFEIECPSDEALAQAMKAAGFTVVMWDYRKLDLCQKYGLKVSLYHGDVDLPAGSDFSPWPPDWQRTYSGLVNSTPPMTPALVPLVRNHPALWGYHLKDEPRPGLFPLMQERLEAFREADPDHPAYINLYSGGREYMQSFLDTVHPYLLSYDWYQWQGSQGPYFQLLEEHRAAALAAGIPLFCWVETGTTASAAELSAATYAADNAVKLRQSVYTCLTYGVTGIEWFSGTSTFEHGTAELTVGGRNVAALNPEISRLGPILVKLKSVDVFHTGDLPGGTRALPADAWVRTRTRDLVLGFFRLKDGTPGDYLMVTNRRIDQSRWAVLQFARPVSAVERLDKHTGQWTALPPENSAGRSYVEFILAPGDGELLRVR